MKRSPTRQRHCAYMQCNTAEDTTLITFRCLKLLRVSEQHSSIVRHDQVFVKINRTQRVGRTLQISGSKPSVYMPAYVEVPVLYRPSEWRFFLLPRCQVLEYKLRYSFHHRPEPACTRGYFAHPTLVVLGQREHILCGIPHVDVAKCRPGRLSVANYESGACFRSS